MIRTVNFLRILSIILFFVVFGYIYAFMPVMVQLNPGEPMLQIHKEYFFYFGMGTFLLINILAWILIKAINPLITSKQGEEAAAWLGALPFVLNISLILIVGFLGVVNNESSIAPKQYAYLNFLVPLLIFIWIFGFIYLIVKKKRTA